MLKNFVIEVNSVDIKVGDDHWDLHNDFDLCKITIDFVERALVIDLASGKSARPGAQGKRLVLRFLDVDFVQLSGGLLKDSCRDVAELGYKSPSDFDVDWLLEEREASAEDHFFLRLGNDEFVRVHSKIVTAGIVPPGIASP